jgi:hypothetical protein
MELKDIYVCMFPGYRSRGLGSIPGTTRFFWEVAVLERGPLSLVSTIEELLGRKSSCSGLWNRDYGRRDPSQWSHGTLYPQKLALPSPTIGGRSGSQATEFSLVYLHVLPLKFQKGYRSNSVLEMYLNQSGKLYILIHLINWISCRIFTVIGDPFSIKVLNIFTFYDYYVKMKYNIMWAYRPYFYVVLNYDSWR